MSEPSIVWSPVNHLTWISDIEQSPVSDFTFLVNGKSSSETSIKKYTNSLHVIFHLSKGLNSIEIKKLGKIIYTADVHYYPIYESEIVPEEAELKPFHSVKQEASCSAVSSCHRMTVIESDLKPDDITKQICHQCHSHKFDGYTSLHKPAAAEWRCLVCHYQEPMETDLSPDEPLRFTIKDADQIAELCYKCHKKLKAFIESKEYIHGPIGMQGCTMCHSPHGSMQKKLLFVPANKLCIDCHEAQDMLEQPVIHEVLLKKGCTSCHHPHSSDYPMQLLSDLKVLCYNCHPKISRQKNNHPVQNHPVFIKEKPPAEGYKVTCLSCHSPHSSEYDKLLPQEEMMMLCVNCHEIGTM